MINQITHLRIHNYCKSNVQNDGHNLVGIVVTAKLGTIKMPPFLFNGVVCLIALVLIRLASAEAVKEKL